MSIADLMPARIRRSRPTPKHRAADEVARLRVEVARLESLRDGANLLVAGLCVQLDDAAAVQQATAELQAEAELLVVQQQATIGDLEAERNEWRDRFLALQARFGPQIAAEENAARVAVPPMARIGCDQDTQSIDVTTLREAAEAGLLPGCGSGRLHAEEVA